MTSFEENPFNKCLALKEVIIPSSVTHIKDIAFCVCSSLKEITIPDSVVFIGNDAFNECGLIKITIPSSSKHYPNKFLSYCSFQ